MKTLTEYILESLIFEKKSLTSRSEKLAKNIINIVTSKNNDNDKFKASKNERTILQNISNDKKDDIDKFYSDKSNIFKFTISIKEQHYDLFFIINCYNEDEIKGKLNTFDFYVENNKTVYYIVMNCIEKIDNIANEKDTLVHELRHFYDKIKGHGGTKNDTYDENTLKKYNKFLYYISQTEQNAFYAGFKQKLNSDENYQTQLENLVKMYRKQGYKTIEEIIKQFCEESYDYRLKNCFQESDDWAQLKEPTELVDKMKCHNPLCFLEYKYYILDSYENFCKFIYENPTNNKKDEKRKKEILGFLESYNNDKPIKNADQLRNVYNGVSRFYNKTFSNYMNLIKNFIRKHMG